MRKLILILILYIFYSSLFTAQAQRTIVVYGKLVDAETKTEINSAPVTVENTPIRTQTNRLGNYYLTVTVQKNRDITIIAKDIRYHFKKQKLSWKKIEKSSGDSIRVDFSLEYYELPVVDITYKPETVYGNRQHHVADYEFSDNKIILLTYERKLEKGSRLLLCREDMHVYANILVPDVAKELFRDFQGHINLVCEEKVYSINVYDTTMGLVPVEKKYFTDQIQPLVDTNNRHIYFSNFIDVYPAFDYFAFNQYDSSYKKLRHLIDKPLMDLYRAQYKYVDGRDKLEAYRAELRTGIDKEIWVALWSGFPQSIYYRPLYAPMFLKEDTILIFDHYTNRLFRYDNENKIIDSIEIDYHLGKTGKEWETQLVKDYTNEMIYGVFQRAGKYFLKELNTQTGEITRVTGLQYKYPERIKVNNNYVYYIYRPFESSQTRFLYKEKINN